MFQDNPLLAQLKQQLHSQTPRVEGVVKGTEKRFGFLEVDAQKSYFIPPHFMKKVMHGDKITAVVHTEKDREIVEPEELTEPFLTRFVGRVQVKDDRMTVVPDHRLIKEVIQTRPQRGVNQTFQTGDWAVAEMRCHPLKGDRQFYAEITALVATTDDHFAPWLVTLARHNLERAAPEMPEGIAMQEDGPARDDLTALDFITIDSVSTEDMDDAIHLASAPDGAWVMTVAIADPTAWVPSGSQLDRIARERAFTNYLPGFSIPMLPHALSDDLCSLRAHERRPALVCRVTLHQDGTIADDARFFIAWVESKAKLAYDHVSDWLENTGSWKPENDAIANQLRMLHDVCQARSAWRQHHALVFRDRPDYRFVLDEKGNVDDIVIEPIRIANRMIEEAMIAANVCAARVLRDGLGYGLYNVHHGFDPLLVDQAATILRDHHIDVEPGELLTLEGFCALHRQLDAMPTAYLDNRIRRFQTFSEVSTVPGPHFGLGLDAYATWTSPIRKYGDMLNHRLLKALIGVGEAERPGEEVTLRLAKRRRQNRMAERDMGDWLYARFLQSKAGSNSRFSAEIIDISRSGMRVRLLDNGAVAFIPAPFIHSVRDELVCSQDTGTVQVKGEERYRQGDTLDVTLAEVRMENRSVIARPV
ncbi:exoribonuclease II [Sodalis-like endosymbiont of Proechinophthirus fluctus]|uniref:exoribonuclease II n=1 Tax=Sodalis-like endosymbiont of Proechinophthirus fluctus TaxID=1462730 RepID=UPI0007A7C40B|nr:exoribonuclease II [Sodalis-like endosymbiont of Proechinophthirus fluctus]KYP97338.1 exoribonuclease II [Sodalis-like endosymbiont of Proechinophthirus fluctus]